MGVGRPRVWPHCSYPVLIKAIKGGGGKGMRIVERAEDFDEMLASSRRESLKSFGDDHVLVEKYLVNPRYDKELSTPSRARTCIGEQGQGHGGERENRDGQGGNS